MKKKKIEPTGPAEAKKIIAKQSKGWLLFFLTECAKDGLIRIDYSTGKKTIQALRLMANAAMDNLHEKILNGEITDKPDEEKKSELLADPKILPSTGRFRYIGEP